MVFLLVHTSWSSSIVWRDIPDALSKYFHTVTVSGASEKPQNADYTTEVDSIIERIEIMHKEHTIFLYSSSVFCPSNFNFNWFLRRSNR